MLRWAYVEGAAALDGNRSVGLVPGGYLDGRPMWGLPSDWRGYGYLTMDVYNPSDVPQVCG